MVYLITKSTILLFTRFYTRKINGIENVPRKGGFIVAGNYSSYLDDFLIPSVLIPLLDKKVHFYVKSSYFKNYFIGRFLKFYESIPVDSEKSWNHEKTNKIALENASHFLKKGDIIGIFPEGSRSHNGILQKAKTGIAKLALLAGVNVLPIGIIGSNSILPRGAKFPRFKKCEVNIGKPINLRKYHGKKITKPLLEKITREIMHEIAKLIGQKYNF